MHWADVVAKKIIASGKYQPYWVDDMKTPSGRIHVGSLRGVLIHDLVHRALIDQSAEAIFTYVFDDSDPMDELPFYLERAKWEQHLGKPLFRVPSPEKSAKTYAEYYAKEFIEVFNKIGSTPKILWTHEFYTSGKMNEYIRLCLDKAADIRRIYEDIYKKRLPENWYPFQAACPNCGKISTTKVTAWDGTEVAIECVPDLVSWTKGCGFSGKASPFSSSDEFAGKLPWKIEWAVKWKLIGVTVEGAGKDHMTAGGSHDVSSRICQEIIDYPVPYPIAYEFFLIGGKKMSSSKGLGSSAKEISGILPPYLLRFVFARTDYSQAINFDPVGTMLIPDLFDEYDRCWQAYAGGRNENFARTFELSWLGKLPPKKAVFLPRFREVANYIQLPDVNLRKKFAAVKGSELTAEEQDILKERETYAKVWLAKYAPAESQIQMTRELPKEAQALNEKQKAYLNVVAKSVESENDADKLQLALYEQAKKLKLNSKSAFAAIYRVFLGRDSGPRAAWFLLQYPKKEVIKRLKEALGEK